MVKIGGDGAIRAFSPNDVNITLRETRRHDRVRDWITEAQEAVDMIFHIFENVVGDRVEDSSGDVQIGRRLQKAILSDENNSDTRDMTGERERSRGRSPKRRAGGSARGGRGRGAGRGTSRSTDRRTATRVWGSRPRCATAVCMPGVRCRGCGCGISVPCIPSRSNRDVDLNVVDDANRGLGEILACGARLDPRIHVTFIRIREVRSDIFVYNEMLAVAAPVFIGADVIGRARLDIVDPSSRGDSNRLGTACVDASRGTVS